jgi:hypothetical protein
VGTQRRRRLSAWVRRGAEGYLRGYAEVAKAQCVGTQGDSRSGACFLQQHAARLFLWVRTFWKVRGAIVSLGAYCTQCSERSSACPRSPARRGTAGIRREAEGELRSNAGQ